MGCHIAENWLREHLMSPGMPPFIGLVSMDEELKQCALRKTRAFLGGSYFRLEELFHQYPYVSAWCISQTLSSFYGDDNHATYPLLERALGVMLGRPNVRQGLHERFCSVVETLGLPGRHTGRMVDTYLLHAGVPESMLGHLASCFLRQERLFGPPPTHSTAELNRWEDESLEFMPPGVVSPRWAIEWDETAWHAALYARIRRDADSINPNVPLERAFKNVLDELANQAQAPTTSSLSIPKPRLFWHADGLTLRLPKAVGQTKVWLDGDKQPYLRQAGDFWTLPQPWPTSIFWLDGESRERLDFLPSPDEFVVFDRTTGRLARSVRGTPNKADAGTTDAVILSRSCFKVNGEPALDLGDAGFLAYAKVRASQLELGTDGGVVRLYARPRRRLTTRGGQIATGPFGPLLGRDAVVEVETGIERDEYRQLRLTVGGETIDVGVDIAEGVGEICVGSLCAALPKSISPDPLKMRIELLVPAKEGRSSRSTGIFAEIWVWPAFLRVDGLVFYSEAGPQNLMLEHSQHVTQDSQGNLTLLATGGYETATAVFKIGVEFIPFEIPWPDVTAIWRKSDKAESVVPLGARLTLGEANRFDTVTIRCPDALASLTVRGRHESRPFAGGLPRNLSVRNLLESADDNKVTLHRQSGHEVMLFELVHALEPSSFNLVLQPDIVRVRMDLVEPIGALALELQHEQGETEFIEIDIGRHPISSCRHGWIGVELPSGNSRSVELSIHLSESDDGLSLARIFASPDVGFEDQVNWHPLRSSKGETYAALLGDFNSSSIASDLSRRFETLNRWLAERYAIECWSVIGRPLQSRWRDVGQELARHPGGQGLLILAADALPSDHSSRTWIPVFHPICFQPGLYSASSEAFARFSGSKEPSMAALSNMHEIGRNRLREQSQLHPAVWPAFRNLMEAQQPNVRLKGFQPNRFFELLPMPMFDNDPSAGWFWHGNRILGPDHWRAAHLRFVERLNSAGLFADDGAIGKKQIALNQLVTMIWNVTPEDRRPPVPKRSEDREEPEYIDLWIATALSEFGRASRLEKVDELTSDLATSLDWTESKVLHTQGLLLRLAPELFSFFLLTWQLARLRP